MRSIEFHPDAQEEFISAAQFYENQSEGLGLDFILTVQRTYEHGVGFWIEMSVDIQALHATGDIPILGRLLSGPLMAGLRQIVERTFQKKLPP